MAIKKKKGKMRYTGKNLTTESESQIYWIMGNKSQKDTSAELNLNEAKSTQICMPLEIRTFCSYWAFFFSIPDFFSS